MVKYKLPGIVYIGSVIGAAGGCAFLFKDYIAGERYAGEEKIYGRTIIVTGANSGIGKETARELARRGGKIYLACRDIKKCEAVREEITKETMNTKVFCKKLDLASMASIREFADDINKNEPRLDILVNNGGVMRCPKLLTKDGFEMQLGVNYLGHFLLTNLLLDKLKKTSPSRIINMLSISHKSGKINFEDLNSEHTYDAADAFNQSQLAIALFTKELAKRLDGTGTTVNAVYPGIVKTDIIRHMGVHTSSFTGIILKPLHFLIVKTPEQGAYTPVYSAISHELEKTTGKLICDYKEKEFLGDTVKDEELSKRLWVTSEKWTRIA